MPPVIAIDAMGGDRAPGEIVAGALAAVDACDVDILLVGRADAIRAAPARRQRARRASRCSQPPKSSRCTTNRPRRCARRRTRRSCAPRKPSATAAPAAMVGAGNTGATMAAALLRFGRIKGVHRPAIAVPLPGARRGPPAVARRRRRHRRSRTGVAGRVGRARARVRPRPARRRRTDDRAACRTARKRARATRCASARRSCSPT